MEAEFLYQRGAAAGHLHVQACAHPGRGLSVVVAEHRQQYHQRMAQVLEAQFPEIVETQPELVAHHYTEAGLSELAITYWQQAGERAVQHSAYVEAIGHFTKGLEVLKAIPRPRARPARAALADRPVPGIGGHPGPAAPETEQAYTRAQELCGQVGETSQLFPCCGDSGGFITTVDTHRARTLGEQLLSLAHQTHDSALLLEAHHTLWATLVSSGELSLPEPTWSRALPL